MNSNGNGNGDVDEVEVFDDESDLRVQAIALTDRTLTAIGGLETEDPAQAAEIVARMYLRMLRAVREEE
jgi:two-component sensor histidine kinase